MKIKILLPLLFGMLVVLGIVQGGLGLFSNSAMETQISAIASRMERTVLIGNMEAKFAEVRRLYAVMLGADTPAEVAEAAIPVKEAIVARKEAFHRFGSTVVNADMKQRYDTLAASVAAYEAAGENFISLMAASKVDDALAVRSTSMTPASTQAVKLMGEMLEANKLLAAQAEQEGKSAASFALLTTIVTIIVVSIIAIAAAMMSFFRIARPIDEITSSMNALAAGDTAREIPHGARKDEIGDMAAAVSVFRANALERERLERDAEANRSLSEKERIAREEQKVREAADVQFAVDGLADGLRNLANGDMTFRLEKSFVGQLDVLRTNYNDSVEKLQAALRSVGENARMIDAGATEIRSATEDLSKRTEQQAASVEETAAALEQVTTAVKDSAVKAGHAGELVARTRAGAERSGEVVRKAVVAMQEIEKSSNEISNIIGVIDDIAFQTNLLALNAGVEAARAGEAGKGFAVVAQEVRELAQRSANAAKEIKALITKSGDQVRGGVALVGETGQALEAIVTEVQDINSNVSAIAASAREQSTGLSEINSAVNQMDQGTQQNAAMVEQSSAATYSLASQAASLIDLLSQFKLDGGLSSTRTLDTASRPQPSSAVRSVSAESVVPRARPSPAHALGNRLTSAFGGGQTSAAAATGTDNWTEF